MKAYQIYQFTAPIDYGNGDRYECYCSACGERIESRNYPSERLECPHCGAELSVDRVIGLERWEAMTNAKQRNRKAEE